jgi:hypothetical protein
MPDDTPAVRPARFTEPIPKYDDTTPVRKYLLKFEHAMKLNSWEKSSWLGYLSISLEGSAESFYYNWLENERIKARGVLAPKPLEFNDFALALQLAFQSHADKSILEEKCRDSKQLINENPESYTFALLALLQELNPAIEIDEQIRWLIRNARPEYIKRVSMHQPSTIDEFLDLMRRVEHAKY